MSHVHCPLQEVRSANKTLQRVEELAQLLDTNRTTAEQQIQEQVTRGRPR